jgi:hypothetical protein
LDTKKKDDITLRFWGPIWLKHYWENLPNVKRGVRLFEGALPETPALIVGAGPSLEKNINQIHKLKGRAVILAVPKSYKLLLREGIEPDVVIVCDAKEGQAKKCFPFGKNAHKQNKTLLVMDTVAHPLAHRMWQDKNRVFWYNKMPVDAWPSGHRLEEGTGPIGQFPQSGNTTNVCWSMAKLLLGCDPIIWVGQDLSWPLGQAQYSGGLDNCYVGDSALDVVDTFIGNPPMKTHRVVTHYSLREFAKWVERKCIEFQGTYYNCTEGGIMCKGMSCVPLKYIVDMYHRKSPITGEPYLKERDFIEELMAKAKEAEDKQRK